jgi:hypothetical protein
VARQNDMHGPTRADGSLRLASSTGQVSAVLQSPPLALGGLVEEPQLHLINVIIVSPLTIMCE